MFAIHAQLSQFHTVPQNLFTDTFHDETGHALLDLKKKSWFSKSPPLSQISGMSLDICFFDCLTLSAMRLRKLKYQ